MKNDAVYTEERKGLIISIYRDDCYQSPDDMGDPYVCFLVGYHRDFYVDKEVRESLARDIARGGKYEDGSINDEAMAYYKRYHIFGLEAYIHSGVCLGLSNEGNFPDRQWDAPQLGLVFVAKEHYRLKKSAQKCALGLIAEWNDYLSGNVYGFVITDKEGNEYGSCWGFYGDYNSYCLEDARSEVDYEAKEIAKISTPALVLG